jgi:DNA-binding LytR/AlgR family response regulator
MNGKEYMFVKHTEGVITKIYYKDIILVMANKDYCNIITNIRAYTVHFTMNGILKILPSDIFCRCNRSVIVNVDKIDYIEKNIIHIGNSSPDLSAMYKDELLKKINFVQRVI